jgi:hypothetical protein
MKMGDKTARLEVIDTPVQDFIFEVHTTAHGWRFKSAWANRRPAAD